MADVVLRFIAGKQQGREFPVKNEQEIVIGRDEDANLRIDEDTVSRKHAVLILKNDEIVLQDFSKNGTYVNGHAIFFVTLKDGDQIHIGRSIFKVVINTPPPTPTWIIGAPRPERTVPAVTPSGSYLSSLSKVATVVPSALSAAKPAPRPAPVGTSTSALWRS